MGKLRQIVRSVLRRHPFAGEVVPTRVPIVTLSSGRPTLPFPHPWNYQEPLRILETYFWGADAVSGYGRHNRYLDVPGMAPVLVTRDPRVIRAIAAATGDKPGEFDRDTLPTDGIARATGADTLLYANGAEWKTQKKLSTPPFARTTLFQPEYFHEFEQTFRYTISQRLDALRRSMAGGEGGVRRVQLEPEIKAVMLEMLANNFFGAEVPYEVVRERYVPALDLVIDNIVCDTVTKRFGVSKRRAGFTRSDEDVKHAAAMFEELTDVVIAPRKHARGLWKQFKSDASDDALRSNIRVFLAGALEATTSYAAWAISHLARDAEVQAKVYEEVRAVDEYTPQTLAGAKHLTNVLEETLRLTPSLYFLPRRASADTWVEVAEGQRLWMPKGTHILLDVWHANRHEDFWGVGVTGHPAERFVPARWENLTNRGSKDLLHFGFGHGPRFCPGKHLGQLEVGLVVGAFVKLFAFSAPSEENAARAGVSTKPRDGVVVDLRLRA